MALTMTDEQEQAQRYDASNVGEEVQRMWIAELDATRARVDELERERDGFREDFDGLIRFAESLGIHGSESCSEAFTVMTHRWEDSRLLLAAREAECVELREALEERGEHHWSCARADFRSGRSRDDGGYECNYGGIWYESRPEDRTPKCDCELALLSRPPGGTEALRAMLMEAVRSGEGWAADSSTYHGGTGDYDKERAEIVARLLGDAP